MAVANPAVERERFSIVRERGLVVRTAEGDVAEAPCAVGLAQHIAGTDEQSQGLLDVPGCTFRIVGSPEGAADAKQKPRSFHVPDALALVHSCQQVQQTARLFFW